MSESRPTLTSALIYRDPRAAIEWLQTALGFDLVMLIEDDGGNLAHCEMRLGNSLIMVGSEWNEYVRSPASLDGHTTQSLHIHVADDVDAHCQRARGAGAEIVAEPETQFYGDRTYRCRDPEGHFWTIGQTVRQVTREDAETASGLKITGWV